MRPEDVSASKWSAPVEMDTNLGKNESESGYDSSQRVESYLSALALVLSSMKSTVCGIEESQLRGFHDDDVDSVGAVRAARVASE